jgi:hypothetical protein
MNIIDSHVHLGPFMSDYMYGMSSTIENLQETYKDYWGIVVMPSDTIENQWVYDELLHSNLNYKFVAWATPKNVAEILSLDFAGLKVHPAYAKVPLIHPYYDPIFKLASNRKVPITCHSGDVDYTYYWHIIQRAKEYPSIQFIIGHMGGKRYQNTWQCPIDALEYDNIFIDTTMKVKHHFIKHCASMVGESRMLFGSDYPIMHPNVGIEAIKVSGIDTEQVLFKTAKELFWR